MTDREKLVEMINHVCEHHIENLLQPGGAEALADHLIANGVTVQQWRDAKTDPPKQGENVLMMFDNGIMAVGFLDDHEEWNSNTDNEWYTYCDSAPVKWQPLPEAVKEE